MATKSHDDDVADFDEKDIPQSAWFKFLKEGDSISGEVVGLSEKKSTDPQFPDQRIFHLKKKDGSVMNVGIPVTKDYIISRTNNVKLGDLIKFEFKKSIPSTKGKGFAPAKSIEVYVKHVKHVKHVDKAEGDNF